MYCSACAQNPHRDEMEIAFVIRRVNVFRTDGKSGPLPEDCNTTLTLDSVSGRVIITAHALRAVRYTHGPDASAASGQRLRGHSRCPDFSSVHCVRRRYNREAARRASADDFLSFVAGSSRPPTLTRIILSPFRT